MPAKTEQEKPTIATIFKKFGGKKNSIKVGQRALFWNGQEWAVTLKRQGQQVASTLIETHDEEKAVRTLLRIQTNEIPILK